MDDIRYLLVAVAFLAALPAWLTGSILARHAKADGENPSSWIPMSVLPYAVSRFKHRHKPAIVFGYVMSNLLFVAAVGAVLWMRFGSR
jgi:integral membrane sensor domain MASE1